MLTPNNAKSNSEAKLNLAFTFPSTPAHLYTPTPTPQIKLPIDTPDPSCKRSFHHLSKEQYKHKKRMNLSDGFPFVDPNDTTQKQIIEIISESTTQNEDEPNQSLLSVNSNDNDNDIDIPNGDIESKQTEQHFRNVTDLKISIPKETAFNTNVYKVK